MYALYYTLKYINFYNDALATLRNKKKITLKKKNYLTVPTLLTHDEIVVLIFCYIYVYSSKCHQIADL